MPSSSRGTAGNTFSHEDLGQQGIDAEARETSLPQSKRIEVRRDLTRSTTMQFLLELTWMSKIPPQGLELSREHHGHIFELGIEGHAPIRV